MAAALAPDPDREGPPDEPTWRQAPDDAVGLQPEKLRQVRARDLGIRFAFGAATSVAAGLVTLAFGARAGGVLLAFPAILAASLTLIAEEEAPEDAREDARGAVVGALALAGFGVAVVLLVTHVVPGLALAAASVAWFALVVSAYFVLWGRR